MKQEVVALSNKADELATQLTETPWKHTESADEVSCRRALVNVLRKAAKDFRYLASGLTE